MIIAISVYTGVVGWLLLDFFHIHDDHHLRDIGVMHSMLSFVLSLLLVFRTNTGYERWWEGRKMWGSLLNNSRNLALKLNGILPASYNVERAYFTVMIANYAIALKNHLRTAFLPDELHSHEWFDKKLLKQERHLPNHIAKEIFNKIHELNREGIVSSEQLIYLNPEMLALTDICGACERIKNTPIPYSYSLFIKKFIFFFIMTLPFTLVFTEGYYAVPTVAFIFYVITSLELLAEEIEDPFGKDANDLPTDSISKNIHKSVTEIFGIE